MPYTPTNWVDDTTPLSASNLDHIETQYSEAMADGGVPYAADTSAAANTITVSISPAPTAYADGLAACIKVANTTTGATTLDLNGLGAIAVHNSDGSAVGAGDLVAGAPVTLRYVGGSFFVLGGSGLSSSGNAAPAQVLTGYTFTSAGGRDQAGDMPNNGAVTLTPSGTGAVAIPAGYHNGAGVVAQVSVPAADVLTGTTIAGVVGTMPNQGSPTLQPGASLAAGYYSGGSAAAPGTGSQSWTTPGNYTWTVPSGVTRILVYAWAGGGGGGAAGTGGYVGGGGGGGGMAYGFFDAAPNENVSITVGSGGAIGTSGGNSALTVGATTITATGGGGGYPGTSSANGSGGQGGSAVNVPGVFWVDGAHGGSGSTSSYAGGGGGAPGAGGSPNPVSVPSTTNVGGGGGYANNGQAGGNGGNGSEFSGTLYQATAPTAPGGGGGGSYTSSAPPTTGSDGMVIIYW